MFYLVNNQSNTFALYTGKYLSTCTMRYTDLATMTEHHADLTIEFQNDRYAELKWEVSATQGQYILELMEGDERIVAHVAYIADAEDDPLDYTEYEYYE